MNAHVLTTTGAEGKAMALPKAAFEQKADPTLMAQSVRVYLSNQRKAAASAQTRSDVNKTTAKMFKQKGTGNARHGSYSAPIFVGGGAAFGPTGEQNYKKSLPRTMARKALAGALNLRAEEKKVWIVEDVAKLSGKTKEVAHMLKDIRHDVRSAVVVTIPKQDMVRRAFRNVAGMEVVELSRLHPYHILKNHAIILTPEAVEALGKLFTA